MTSPAGPNRSRDSTAMSSANSFSVSWNTRGVAPHGPGPGCPAASSVTPGCSSASSTASVKPAKIRPVSIAPPDEAPTASPIADSRPTSSGTNSRPGLVQNWPVPSVSEPVYPVAMAAGRENAAPGSTTDGLTEPSSP